MNQEIIQFLRELAANNDRAWFQENKQRYERLRDQFIANVQLLINKTMAFDPEISGLEAKDCLFRIYRDIRFSPNKMPYKTYFGAYIAQGGRRSIRGGYYLHLQPGACMLSGGVWCPEPKLLKQLRKDIYDHIEEFTAIMETPQFKHWFSGLDGESLKRMPVGYPQDSPYADIMKHKDFCVTAKLPDNFFFAEDWADRTVECFKALQPFNQFLNYTVDEFLGRV